MWIFSKEKKLWQRNFATVITGGYRAKLLTTSVVLSATSPAKQRADNRQHLLQKSWSLKTSLAEPLQSAWLISARPAADLAVGDSGVMACSCAVGSILNHCEMVTIHQTHQYL